MTMRKSVTPDGRATRIPAEPEVERIAALLAARTTTRGQRAIINTTLRELAEATDAKPPKSRAVLRAFYFGAAYRIGAAGPRWRMREALRLIAEGETFADYKKGDHLHLWKMKRARRNHSGTKGTGAELARRLSDQRTPADYRAALASALRDFCAAAGTKYRAQDPARSYVEADAEGEGEKFDLYRVERRRHDDAHWNLHSLLEGLRKRRPLGSLDLRGAGRPEGERQGREPGQQDEIAALRERLAKLDEEDDQILRCTERFKIEKEIYDLEHPKDLDDWSAWEEGDER